MNSTIVDEEPVTFCTLKSSPPETTSTMLSVSAVWKMSMSPERSDWRRTFESGIGSILISSRYGSWLPASSFFQ